MDKDVCHINADTKTINKILAGVPVREAIMDDEVHMRLEFYTDRGMENV